MAQLRHANPEIEARGARVVVVGPEDSVAFAREWEREHFPFVGLPDPDHAVLSLYGQQFKLTRLGRLPAMVVVGRDGLVRWAHYGDSMRDIPGTAELLEVLDELKAKRSAPARSGRAGRRAH